MAIHTLQCFGSDKCGSDSLRLLFCVCTESLPRLLIIMTMFLDLSAVNMKHGCQKFKLFGVRYLNIKTKEISENDLKEEWIHI